MRVDSDNPVVRDRIKAIASTVTDHGGYIHPQLVVRHEGPSLSLALPHEANPYVNGAAGEQREEPHPNAPALLVIPDKLYIPVTDLDWEPHDTVLRYRSSADHLSDPQRLILDAMVDAFNAVDKVRLIGQSYPARSLSDDPELLAMLREARPQMELVSDDPVEASPSMQVVRSRLRSATVEGEEGPVGFFMPMIDLLNHHPFGARYRRMDDDTWRVDVHHPTRGDQVFVRYHRADALATAIGLGYFEAASRHVLSVACTLRVPGFGTARVRGVAARRAAIPAPRIVREEHGWGIAGLVIEPRRIAAVRTLLAMPLIAEEPARDPQEVHTAVDALLKGAIAANVDFYRRLHDLCVQTPEQARTMRLRRLFAEVSRHQLRLLDQAELAIAQPSERA